ncbi:hypothetical protein DYB28_002774 [Aphanomyces astaci]|uniref:Uncharacterized protein n=1 Tax=Aphanomyces astaci TaxID=112090 RepID=A0A397B3T5_APHAT|nr:hypothetical protein DYB25_005110 [Aphanomyces astaci]RHY46529.1 hypothetical protein DYB34_010565 [Aphanomyces astaci]RHZ08093.1 hypothetical protein DYB31_006994 [Aphanomyces astaci]RLO07847.1 hypothetical protein DYB28_002774 [Aphanomyces astaci]
MSLNSTSAPSFVGTPLDESRPLAYATWKTDFLPQATIRDIMWYFTEPNHVPFEIRREALKISKETSGKSSRTMFRLPELPVRLSLLTMFGLPSALSSTIVPNVLLLWVTSALSPLPQLALRTRPLRMPLRPHTATPGIQPA